MPPAKDLTWFASNGEVIDSGTGINVRLLEATADGVNDASQSWHATHTNDNVFRCFLPATANAEVGNDPSSVLIHRGWAIPLSELTPTDVRCRALLPAQTVTVRFVMALGWSGSPVGTNQPTTRAGLFRYNPTTDTGTLIAGASGTFPTFWGVFGSGNGTAQVSTISLAVPDTILERDEILLLQLGAHTGTLSNPVFGTVDYYGNLHIGLDPGTNLTFAETLQALCTHGDDCPAVSAPARELIVVRATKQLAAAAQTAKTLGVAAAKAVPGVGVATRTTATAKAPAVVAGRADTARAARVFHDASTAAVPAAQRSLVVVRALKTLSAVAATAASRLWEAVRYATAEADATTTFDRTVIFVRYAQVAALGEADPNDARISLPLADLPDSTGSGETIVKKFFPILD